MVRLIPLPDRDGQAGDSRLWINPEHITSISPIISRGQNDNGETFVLSVELKLEGLPMQRAWLGSCVTAEEADAKWQSFLDLVSGPQEPQAGQNMPYLT